MIRECVSVLLLIETIRITWRLTQTASKVDKNLHLSHVEKRFK